MSFISILLGGVLSGVNRFKRFTIFAAMDKMDLANTCLQLLQQKMNEAETAMKAAQESANSNEKSSMGDKYETGRAMGQLDRDMHAKRLASLQTDFRNLLKIDLSIMAKQVELGSLVQTETFYYWIAVALGPVMLNQEKVMVISPVSPIAKLLMGKKMGDRVDFNGNKSNIISLA